MPELPEVESVRRMLRPRLVGQTIRRATLYRRDIAATHDARTPRPRDLLQGARVVRLERRGKNLALIASDGRTLCVHLGMTGSLTYLASPPPPRHLHATWRLREGWLAFHDPRRFGRLRTFPSRADLFRLHWASLGPDALHVTGHHLATRLGRSRRPLKAALLDQQVLAGVGNIYADEALFVARLPPAARCGELPPEAWGTLAEAIRRVLRSAIRHGGSTIRSYRDAFGQPGGFQARHAVYGRGGLPCVICAAPLQVDMLGGRTTTWCPSCQSVVSLNGVS